LSSGLAAVLAAVAADQAPRPEDTPAGPDRIRAAAHLWDTVFRALNHIRRHLDSAQNATSPESLAFNMEHVENHLNEAVDHHRRLAYALAEYHPDVARELRQLHEVTQSGPEPAAPARSASPPLLDFRCGSCGGPKTPGGPCDECDLDRQAYQRAADEARARMHADVLYAD
jgi:hypothetical protein